ncbi:uncharacterized protein [Pseudorca crassidens]|uniref:uncharacterized protein n=1 Tax=Pseudorca crassidens TaxID=82174 RepID=UPI00352D5FCE
MDRDTTFPPFNISAQHWRVTYKPPTNKQRRSLAGEGEEEAGEGDVRSFPSQKVPRQTTESRAVLRPHCFPPAKFSSGSRKEVGNLPPPSVAASLQSAGHPDAPPHSHPSQGLHLGPGVSLPASNFLQTHPAPSWARPGCCPLPLPAAPHVLGARVAAGPTHRPSAQLASRSFPLAARPAPGRGSPVSTASCTPVRREDAVFGAGLLSPLTRPLSGESIRRRRPSQTAPAYARRPAAGPPPGHRAAPALRLASSRPPRHIQTRPPTPFLPAGVQASRGGESQLDRRPPLCPGPLSPPPRVLGLRGFRGKQESVRARGKGKDAEEKGKPRPAAPTRYPLRSGSNNQFIIKAPTARSAKARSNESSSSPRPRARPRSRRLSAPGSRHDAEKASATVSVVGASAAAAAAAAAATEVAVASASRAT